MTDLNRLKDHVKATVTMDEVCERLGIRVPASRKIPSIYRPDERTPSLHVYKGDFYDYSTGRGGDVITFVMDHQGWSFMKALKWLARQHSGFVTTRTHEPAPLDDVDLTDVWSDAYGVKLARSTTGYSQWQGYAENKWGVPIPTIEFYGSIVHESGKSLWTPHWHDGKVRGIKLRGLDGSKVSWPGSQYRHGLYTVNRAEDRTWLGSRNVIPEAWIVEGESDTWALQRYFDARCLPHDVYGLPSGATMWRDSWRNGLMDYARIFVVLDEDEAGDSGRERILGSLRTREWGGPASYALIPKGGRVAESLKAGDDPYTAWNQIA